MYIPVWGTCNFGRTLKNTLHTDQSPSPETYKLINLPTFREPTILYAWMVISFSS